MGNVTTTGPAKTGTANTNDKGSEKATTPTTNGATSATAGATSAPTTGPATPTVTADPDRGNIGNVEVAKDTDEWTSVRSKASTNPVHVAVREAVKGEPYRIAVDNDAKKIERVKRMLRSAAQNYDVGMSIHPDSPEVPGSEGKRVFVRFRTGDRDKRETTGTATADKTNAATGNKTTTDGSAKG